MPIEYERLDELLLDAATSIELSDHDQQIAEKRYRILKQHLERPSSPLRNLLIHQKGRIYAQGSVATSTAIVNGTEKERFDVDAIVEINVPSHWSDEQALDELFASLQGFPGAIEIERCTRCVQIRFAFMHMDVTILDRTGWLPIERAGEIFHSPDDAPAYRVDANPWGFSDWLRKQFSENQPTFAKAYEAARLGTAYNRLELTDAERSIKADLTQDDLPAFIPARLDAQEAVALKLLKRYLRIQYADSDFRYPPSIYLAKLAGDFGLSPTGLCGQLIGLARFINRQIASALDANALPDERNPTYDPDRINDRWPQSFSDLEQLNKVIRHLIAQLEIACSSDAKGMIKLIEELFGERAATATKDALKRRYDNNEPGRAFNYVRGTGAILAPSAPAAAAPALGRVQQHNFHVGLPGEET